MARNTQFTAAQIGESVQAGQTLVDQTFNVGGYDDGDFDSAIVDSIVNIMHFASSSDLSPRWVLSEAERRYRKEAHGR